MIQIERPWIFKWIQLVLSDPEKKTREINGIIYTVVKSGKMFISPDGKCFRFRREELVEIPFEWIGKCPSRQNISQRKSKQGQGKQYKCKKQRKSKK